MKKEIFENKINELKLNEFSFNDQKIKYIGKISKEERKELNDKVFGYYKNENNKYIFFIYNLKENGIMDSIEYNTEDKLFEDAFDMIECEYYVAWCKDVQEKMNDKVTQLLKYLNDEYDQNIIKAASTVKRLIKANTIMIELLFYMDHKRFVPDKYALTIDENSARIIYEKEKCTVLDAFEEMAKLVK